MDLFIVCIKNVKFLKKSSSRIIFQTPPLPLPLNLELGRMLGGKDILG